MTLNELFDKLAYMKSRLDDEAIFDADISEKVTELEKRLKKVECSSSEKKDTDAEGWIPYSYCERDVEVAKEYLEWYLRNKKDSTFSQFDSGERAIVFSDADYLEKDYLDFWRGYAKWYKEKNNGAILANKSISVRREALKPFFEQPSIYDDRKPFAIWLCIGKGEFCFRYETLPSNWRALNTIKGLPYTDWSE